jgi:hypothetical protein
VSERSFGLGEEAAVGGTRLHTRPCALFWSVDTIHGTQNNNVGPNDACVFYIPATPLTEGNAVSLFTAISSPRHVSLTHLHHLKVSCEARRVLSGASVSVASTGLTTPSLSVTSPDNATPCSPARPLPTSQVGVASTRSKAEAQ